MKTLAICAILASLLSSIVGATPIETASEAVTHADLSKRGHNMALNEMARCDSYNKRRVYSIHDASNSAKSARNVVSDEIESFIQTFLSSQNNPNKKKIPSKSEIVAQYLQQRTQYPLLWPRSFPGRNGPFMKYPLTKHKSKSPDFIILDTKFKMVDIIKEDGTSCPRVELYLEENKGYQVSDSSEASGSDEEDCGNNCRQY